MLIIMYVSILVIIIVDIQLQQLLFVQPQKMCKSIHHSLK
eukprot:UN07339